MKAACCLAVILVATQLSHAAGVTELRLQKGARPVITLTGTTQQAKESVVAAVMQKQYPAFDSSDPACKSLVWYMPVGSAAT